MGALIMLGTLLSIFFVVITLVLKLDPEAKKSAGVGDKHD